VSLVDDLDRVERPRALQQPRDLPALALANLEHKVAARTQEPRGVVGDPLMDGQAVGPGVERFAWFVLEQVRAISGEPSGGDERGRRGDEIDRSLEAVVRDGLKQITGADD